MKKRNPAEEIANFYNDYPFPNLRIKTKKDLKTKGVYQIIHPLTHFYLQNKKMKILDAGCGTGELMLAIEKRGMDIEGIDLNIKSIEIARQRAKKFKSKIKFKVFDFVKNSLPEKYYDMVYSIGVLHHTNNPEKSFNRLVRTVKTGGYISIGIYNPFGEFKYRVRRGIVHLLAGKNIQKRVEIGQKLFYRRDYKLSEEEWIGIADAYANPYRKYYSFEQLLNWFKRNNIEFINCVPPIELRQNINFAAEIFNNVMHGKGLNLFNALNNTYKKEIKIKKWELNPIFTLMIQISWLLTGRGTLTNIVGRKIK